MVAYPRRRSGLRVVRRPAWVFSHSDGAPRLPRAAAPIGPSHFADTQALGLPPVLAKARPGVGNRRRLVLSLFTINASQHHAPYGFIAPGTKVESGFPGSPWGRIQECECSTTLGCGAWSRSG